MDLISKLALKILESSIPDDPCETCEAYKASKCALPCSSKFDYWDATVSFEKKKEKFK